MKHIYGNLNSQWSKMSKKHDFEDFNGSIAWFYAVKKYFIIVNFLIEKVTK